jgi:chaperonin cofactor prefoldin
MEEMLKEFKKAHQEFEKLSGDANPIIKTLQRIYKNAPPVFKFYQHSQISPIDIQ